MIVQFIAHASLAVRTDWQYPVIMSFHTVHNVFWQLSLKSFCYAAILHIATKLFLFL